ncbi:hypothetical protein GRI72_00240 [Altererythrobacter marinus]|uniref:Helix-turn-helix domain-containing protein n=1 Tax=Pelagerythrobacter marinus TaxID=538382 RepID=A0ABW9UQV4_9SPHN|nr:hypothetical protein [Pelagerythrobacter marinus]MXO67264.1 hypothetical protein [Pelagerythrobacter marinus]
MKRYFPSPPRRWVRPRGRIPLFHAVPTRQRADGWTPERQARFIGFLAETRSVTEAARRVSMARETAYRLRERPCAESFARAWDAALGRPAGAQARGKSHPPAAPGKRPRKVTNEELGWRVGTGLWQVRIYRGRFVGVMRKPDNTALLRLLARLDRARAEPS